MGERSKIKISTKYVVDLGSEFQKGSRKRVLKNLPRITSTRAMEDAELIGYMRAEREMLGRFGPRHVFSVKDINAIHRSFLGSMYEWAGSYRTVNLSKGGFPFATAMAIPSMMKRLEKKILSRNTPCIGSTINEIESKIAIVHVELLLIHPYREGNGRTARLLATLMAYQAELPGIDFGFIGSRGKEFDNYITAIQQGIDENYERMREITRRAIQRALRRSK